jgi:hypothetical protein
MENIFVRPLPELTDTELLDLLDLVSAELKKRNSLGVNPNDADTQESVRRATDYFVGLARSITNR